MCVFVCVGVYVCTVSTTFFVCSYFMGVYVDFHGGIYFLEVWVLLVAYFRLDLTHSKRPTHMERGDLNVK